MKGFFIKFDSSLLCQARGPEKPRVTVHYYCVSWKRKSRVNEKEIETRPSGECAECSTSSSSNLRPISGKKSSSFETAIARSSNFRALHAVTRDTHRAFYVSTVRAITSFSRACAHPSLIRKFQSRHAEQ